MQTLQGDLICLRALEPTDLDLLYQLENDEQVWEVSNTTKPFSKFVLKQYLDNSYRDIYEVKQLRLVIFSAQDDKTFGFIDLFDFEPKHQRVGVGIVIFNAQDRGKGYAAEALKLLENYVSVHLKVHQLYANISVDNERSIILFEKAGYKKSGEKKDWIISKNGFKDELFFQLILNS
jgi:diamine N-acetyltransferase